jgi:transcriptional regulator with XRE-family HTH domain
MTLPRFADLRSVREELGKSQSELAALLGVSTRAVQSYEQGWRPIPPHVQKMAALLFFLSRRKEVHSLSPCWKVRNCAPDTRAECPAFEFKAGDLCWLLTGTRCGARKGVPWEAKLAECVNCQVMQNWTLA